MSNPAVFKLNRTTIRDNVFQIEDNIGESIHFHIGLVRFDLSIEEFNNTTEVLMRVLNEQLKIKNFDLTSQNEYFLERIAESIPYIAEVKEICIKLRELKYRYQLGDEEKEAYLVDTPIYKYYKGNHHIINEYVVDTEIWQSKEELLEEVKKSRNDNVYIDDDLFILDGYKSLCAGLAFDDISDVIKVKQIIVPKKQKVKCVLKREIEQWWMLR